MDKSHLTQQEPTAVAMQDETTRGTVEQAQQGAIN
jgi:hypothetical protein